MSGSTATNRVKHLFDYGQSVWLTISGKPRASVTENVTAAYETMDRLATAGISMADVTDKLLQDGLTQFVDAFQGTVGAVYDRASSLHSTARGHRRCEYIETE